MSLFNCLCIYYTFVLPFQVSALPPSEQYSDEYKVITWLVPTCVLPFLSCLSLTSYNVYSTQLDIINAKMMQLNSCGLPPMPDHPWEGLEELGSIYSATFPEPAVSPLNVCLYDPPFVSLHVVFFLDHRAWIAGVMTCASERSVWLVAIQSWYAWLLSSQRSKLFMSQFVIATHELWYSLEWFVFQSCIAVWESLLRCWGHS